MTNLDLMQFLKYKSFYVLFVSNGHDEKTVYCLLFSESLTNHQGKDRKYPSNKCKIQLEK